MMQQLLAFLIYPGLLTTLILALLVSLIARTPAPGGGLTRGLAATLRGRGSLLLLVGALAPALVTVWLPWPNPWRLETYRLGDLWLVWAVLEASFAAALLPGLQSPSPTSVRAAVREAQLGAAGRLTFWAALGVSLWAGQPWTLQTAAAHGLALVAALIALPAAAGWGPFLADPMLLPGGPEADLNRASAQLAQWGRALRTTVLLTLIPVLVLPRIPGVPWWINFALVAVVTLLLASMGRALNNNTVRRPLLDGLQWCYARVLPLVMLAGIALVVGQRWL